MTLKKIIVYSPVLAALWFLFGFTESRIPRAAQLPVSYTPAGLPAPRPVLVDALREAMTADVAYFCRYGCDYQTQGNEAVATYGQMLLGFQDYFLPLLKNENTALALYNWTKPAMQTVWKGLTVQTRSEYRRALQHALDYAATYNHDEELKYLKRCKETPRMGEDFFVRFGPKNWKDAFETLPDVAEYKHPQENVAWRYRTAKAAQPLLNAKHENFRRIEAFIFRRVDSGVAIALVQKALNLLLSDFPLVEAADPNELVKINSPFEKAYVEKGVLNGDYVSYYEDGTVWQKGEYRNGQKHGEWKYFLPKEKESSTETWKNGKLHGQTVIKKPSGFWYHGFYYPKPAVQTIDFKENLVYKVTLENPNGDLIREETYDPETGTDALVKIPVEWEGETVYRTGKERYREFYLAGSGIGVFCSAGYLANGVWKTVAEDEKTVLAEERYENGVRKGAASYYRADGQKLKSVLYKSPEGEEPFTVFEFTGKLLTGKTRATGNYALYTAKGNLYVTGENIDSPTASAWTVFHYNEDESLLLARERYIGGKLQGESRYFDANGHVKYEINYHEGRLVKAKGNIDALLPDKNKWFALTNDKRKPPLYKENFAPYMEGSFENNLKEGVWRATDGSDRATVYHFGFEHDFLAEAESRRKNYIPANKPQPVQKDSQFDEYDHALFFLRFRKGLPMPSLPDVQIPETNAYDWGADDNGLATEIPRIFSGYQKVVDAYNRHLALFPNDAAARQRLLSFLWENGLKNEIQQTLKNVDLNQNPAANLYAYRAAMDTLGRVNDKAAKFAESYLKSRDDNGIEALANSDEGYNLAKYFAQNKKPDLAFQLLELHEPLLLSRKKTQLEADFQPILADPRWQKLINME